MTQTPTPTPYAAAAVPNPGEEYMKTVAREMAVGFASEAGKEVASSFMGGTFPDLFDAQRY